MSNHHQSGRSLVEAEHHIKEAFEILREETSRLRQEQESIDAMSKKLDQVHQGHPTAIFGEISVRKPGFEI